MRKKIGMARGITNGHSLLRFLHRPLHLAAGRLRAQITAAAVSMSKPLPVTSATIVAKATASVVACAVILPLSVCHADPDIDAREAKRRIVAAFPPGWNLIRSFPASVPFSDQPDRPRKNPTGERLVLDGPATIRVAGYYCDNAYCARDAKEALELWIMPRSYNDDHDAPNLLGFRAAESIMRSQRVQVFALVSRDYGNPSAFDAAFNGSSSETKAPSPTGSGDLGLTWASWRRDLIVALEKGRK